MYQPPYDPNAGYDADETAYTVDGSPQSPYADDPAYQTPLPGGAAFQRATDAGLVDGAQHLSHTQ